MFFWKWLYIYKTNDVPVIFISKNGLVGTVGFHDYKVVSTADVLILKLKNEKIKINKKMFFYFKYIIEKNKINFNYGRKINSNRINQIKIPIPWNYNKNIKDWEKFNYFFNEK